MTSVCWTHACLQYILTQGWRNLQEKLRLRGVLNEADNWVSLGSCVSRPPLTTGLVPHERTYKEERGAM